MNDRQFEMLEERLIRLESRLSQLMLHMGLDPQVRLYDTPRQFIETKGDNQRYPLPLRKSR